MSTLRWRLASHEEGAQLNVLNNCCLVSSPLSLCIRILSSLYFIVRTCIHVCILHVRMCGCGINLVYYKQMANWCMHYSCVYIYVLRRQGSFDIYICYMHVHTCRYGYTSALWFLLHAAHACTCPVHSFHGIYICYINDTVYTHIQYMCVYTVYTHTVHVCVHCIHTYIQYTRYSTLYTRYSTLYTYNKNKIIQYNVQLYTVHTHTIQYT